MKTQIISPGAGYIIAGLILVFLLSLALTACIRKYAVKHSVIDEPNERSSHSLPTPTGGGLSISLCVLASIIFTGFFYGLPPDFAIALGGGAIIVSVTGWIDDHRDIAASWRAISYLLAAVWSVFWIGGLNTISLGSYDLGVPYLTNVLAVLGIAWLTNLFNFMDGTDALAALQSICAAFLSGTLFILGAQYGVALVCFTILAASAGFLVWNWPPARIFMGDVGSCLIGFLFGVLAIIGEKTESVPIAIWIVILAVFIGDATLTLIRRIVTGERWYSAHKSHAYQRFIQLGASHKKLALAVLFINMALLWPLALLTYYNRALSIYTTILAILIITAIWLLIQSRHAGLRNTGNDL